MKKVLIITYYWPPSGGPGVQRVLKFAKYLPQFGWQPIILTVKNGEYPAIDETLEKDIPPECIVYKTKSWEPSNLYKKFAGMKKNEKIPVAVLSEKNVSWKKKSANWIRLNLFIPDAKIGWIPFAVKAGKKIIKEHHPDVIFSSSPPHSLQFIAKKLAKWSGLKWVADFRDPWTDIYHYDNSSKLKFAQKWDAEKEKRIIRAADIITSVSKNVIDLFQRKVTVFPTFSVIPNGFDEDDFVNFQSMKSEKFIIAYGGKINNQQNPKILWEVLKKKSIQDREFQKNLKLLLIGNIAADVIKDIKDNRLGNNLELLDYMNHGELLYRLQSATILLLLIPDTKNNAGILTGKLFEYLTMKKYILGFGPINGDSNKIIQETNTGEMVDFNDVETLESIIRNQYENWRKGISPKVNEENINQFSRRNITRKFVELF